MRTVGGDFRPVVVAASSIPKTCLKCPVWLRTGQYTCTDLDLPMQGRCRACIHRNHFPDLHEGEGRCPIVVASCASVPVLLCAPPRQPPDVGRCHEPPCASALLIRPARLDDGEENG